MDNKTFIEDAKDVIKSNFFNAGPTLAFIWKNDTFWSVETVSENVKKILGYEASDFISKDILYSDLIHHADLSCVTKEVSFYSHNNSNSFSHKPYRIRNKKGEYLWINDTTYIVYNQLGDITHYIGYINDCTNEMMLLENATANERRLEISQKLAHIGSWELDIRTKELVWSNEIYNIFEIDNTKFSASYEGFLNGVHPEDRDKVEKAYLKSLQTREKYQIIHKLMMEDGRIKYVEEQCETEFDTHNNPIISRGTVLDITDKVLIQNELISSRQMWIDAIERNGDGLWEWNIETNEVYFSPQWKKMLGYSEDEIQNELSQWTRLVHPDDLEKANEDIELYLSGQRGSYTNTHRVLCKDKSYKWILDRGSISEYRSDGKPLKLVGTHRDITQEIESNKKFEEQAKLASMGEMIGNIAHQWRQPLTIISTVASGIQVKKQYGLLDIDRLDEMMESILVQTNYLSKTIDDFRNFIKNTNKAEEISIVQTIEKTISILHSAIADNHITLISQLEDDMTIFGYENELIQAFINIINNAKDALKENHLALEDKLIFITTQKKGDTLYVTFKDNGGGIKEDIMKRIFEPYFTTKHQSVGTGIGLSMTHSILTKRHKATIEVKNISYLYHQKEYTGASFIIGFYL